MDLIDILLSKKFNKGSGGTTNYLQLINKPKINNVELNGNKTAQDLGLAAQSDIPTVPVKSVNGKTGAVSLVSGDIAYDKSITYQAGSVGVELQEQSQQLNDLDNDIINTQGMLAMIEATATASKNYSVDDLLIYNGQLYKVTSAIAKEATIIVGSNVMQTTIEDQLGSSGGSQTITDYVASIGALGTVALGTTWAGSDPYTSVVTVTGYTVTEKTLVNILPDPAVVEQMQDDGITEIFITNNNGVLTATAVGGVPTQAITLNVLCTESDFAADIDELSRHLSDLDENQIPELKNAIGQLQYGNYYGAQEINIGKSINTASGVNIIPSSIRTESGFCCLCIPCVPGDLFIISGSGGSQTRLWAFSDSSGNAINQATAGESATEKELTAPANSAYFAFNSRTSVSYSVYKKQQLIIATTTNDGLMSASDKTKLEDVYADYSSALVALGVI